MTPLRTLIDWLTPADDETVADVDTGFLLKHDDRFKYVSVFGGDPARCRCDLCGSQYALEEFPQLVEHVAGHDDQGGAEIDPFAEAEERTVIGEDLLGEVEEWRRENAEEVEQ